ncbi:MAG: hypothetical protein IKS17_08455 [Firmicutes bacterium]|nr:hypothetical protein [Bacillota bacterium]
MTAKFFLNQIRRITMRIKFKQQEIAEMEANIKDLHGTNFDDVKVQQSCTGGAGFEDMVAYTENLRAELNRDLAALAKCRHDIISKLNMLEKERYSRVLFLKYVKLMDYAQIGTVMGYSVNYTREIHSKAIREFEHLLMQMKKAM